MSEVSNNPQVNNIQALASGIQKAVTENKGQLGSHTVVVVGKEQMSLSNALSRMTELQTGLSKGDRAQVEDTLHNTFVMISDAKQETKDIAQKMDVVRSRSGSQISSGEVSEAGSTSSISRISPKVRSEKLENFMKEIHQTETSFATRVDNSTKFLQMMEKHFEDKGEVVPKELKDTLEAYKSLKPGVASILEAAKDPSDVDSMVNLFSSGAFNDYTTQVGVITENSRVVDSLIKEFEKTPANKELISEFTKSNEMKESVQSMLSGAFQRGPRHVMFMEGMSKEITKIGGESPQVATLQNAQAHTQNLIKEADERLDVKNNLLKAGAFEVRDSLLNSASAPKSNSRISKMASKASSFISTKEIKGFEKAYRTGLEVKNEMPELLDQVKSHYKDQIENNSKYQRIIDQADADYS